MCVCVQKFQKNKQTKHEVKSTMRGSQDHSLSLKAKNQPVIQNILLWLPRAVPTESQEKDSKMKLESNERQTVGHLYTENVNK